MKNKLCVLVGLGCIAAWYYTRPEPAPAPAPAPAVVAAAAPASAPRTYYHSPLDAPAMSTSDHTNLGYFDATPGGFRAVYTSNARPLAGPAAGGSTAGLGGYTGSPTISARAGGTSLSVLNTYTGVAAPPSRFPAASSAEQTRLRPAYPANNPNGVTPQ